MTYRNEYGATWRAAQISICFRAEIYPRVLGAHKEERPLRAAITPSQVVNLHCVALTPWDNSVLHDIYNVLID
jgi:hypothetical protein